jgi:hypothetical protein
MVELIHLDYLGYFLGIFVAIFGTLALMKAGIFKPQIRRLFQLDGLDELIGSCAERGKPIAFSNRYYDQRYPYQLMATNFVLKYVGTKCAELNVPMYGTGQRAQTMMINEDWFRQGFIEAGYPERFVPGRFFAANQCQFAMMGLIPKHDVGGVVAVATGNRATTVYEAALRNGALIWAETTYGFPSCWNSIMCDWYLNGDELNAIAAYVSKDEQLVKNIITIDSVKLFMIFMYFGTWITKYLGLW